MQNELEIFKKILNTLPNSIYLKDMQGRYVWLNQASIKQLEYKHSIFDSIIGKTDFEVFSESNAMEYVKNDQKVIKKRKGISTEEEVLLPNGKKLIQLSFKEPLYEDGSSELIGVLGYTVDITEEKQAQEALKQANQARLRFASTAAHEVINHVSCVVSFAERLERNLTTLQNILPREIHADKKISEAESVLQMLAETLEDYLPARVFWKDKEGVYFGCNAAFARSVLLSKPEDVLGKTDYDLPVKKEDCDAYRKNDEEVMRTGLPKLNIEEKQAFENGQEVFLLTSKVPLFDEEGEVIGVLGVYSDITQKKQAQEALKQANQARLRFASTAAHEVINHVGCVVSFAERLERNLTTLQNLLPKEISAGKKTSELESVSRILVETLEDCKDMRSAAEGGIRAIRNISDLQHMQLNKIEEVDTTLLDMQQFLDVAIRQSTYPNTHHVQIEQSIHPSVPSKIIIDLINLLPAFGIVMGNAFRFSHPGGKVQITVKKLRENKRDCVVISVQDFGVGMHPSQIKNLSMSLVDADAQPESLYAKPSVQLSRAKMYLEVFQGRLEIESVLNQGTEVKLIVPYTLPAQEKSAKKKMNNPAQYERKGKKQPAPMCSVLLVEDEPITRKITAQNLVALGYAVDVAKDGAEAIALAQASDYAVVLLDITLPDMNGLDVMREIRASKGEEPIFIALSSHASEEKEDYFMRQGVVTLLAKPANNEKLKSVIDAALEVKARLDQGYD